MVKASLKKATTAPVVSVAPATQAAPAKPATKVTTTVTKTPTPVVDVEVESVTTAAEAAPAESLESLVDSQPACDGPVSPEEQAEQRAVAPRPSQAVARQSDFGGDGFEGEFGQDDLRFPQMKIVQGSGKASTLFPEGTLIYNNIELLPPPNPKAGVVNPELRFVPILIKKQWREWLSDEATKAGAVPRTVDTVAEVEELGGTTQWIGSGPTAIKPSWSPSGRCMFLIEKPVYPEGAEEHPGFCLELDGKQWAVAVYYAASKAWTNVPQLIFNMAKTSLLVPALDAEGKVVMHNGRPVKRQMIYKNVWRFSWKKTPSQNGKFNPYAPTVMFSAKEETGPEVRAYIESLRSNDADAAAAE